MKAKLIFDTTDPDDRQEFLRCSKSLDMSLALWDVMHLRKKLATRYEVENNSNNDVFDGIDGFADEVLEILDKYNINLDELV